MLLCNTNNTSQAHAPTRCKRIIATIINILSHIFLCLVFVCWLHKHHNCMANIIFANFITMMFSYQSISQMYYVFCIYYYFLQTTNCLSMKLNFFLFSADVLYSFFSGTRWHENVIQTTEIDILFFYLFLFLFLRATTTISSTTSSTTTEKKVFHNFFLFNIITDKCAFFQKQFYTGCLHSTKCAHKNNKTTYIKQSQQSENRVKNK